MACGIIATPTGPVIAAGIGSACAGAFERYLGNIGNGRPAFEGVFDPKDVAVDFAIGAALGYGFSKIPGLRNAAGGAADDLVDDLGDDIADDIAGGADDLADDLGDDIADDGARSPDDAPECVVNSFGAATLVLMADATTKAISDVEVGDQVLATDPETGETGAREVVATIPHTDHLLTLDTSAGEIVTTEDHKYWNKTDAAWQESQDLDNGDELLTIDGGLVIVEGLDWVTSHTADAYDLSVFELHTFYVGVGPDAILVHNEGEAGRGDAHGKQGRAMKAAEPKIAELKEQLKQPGLTGGAKREIKQKIENLRKQAQRADKGETHGRRGKGC